MLNSHKTIIAHFLHYKGLFSLLFCAPTWLLWRQVKTNYMYNSWYSYNNNSSALLFHTFEKITCSQISVNLICNLKPWLILLDLHINLQ